MEQNPAGPSWSEKEIGKSEERKLERIPAGTQFLSDMVLYMLCTAAHVLARYAEWMGCKVLAGGQDYTFEEEPDEMNVVHLPEIDFI